MDVIQEIEESSISSTSSITSISFTSILLLLRHPHSTVLVQYLLTFLKYVCTYRCVLLALRHKEI